MKNLQGGSLTRSLAMCLGLLACASVARAHPYASGITNNSGTIYFILNESNSAVTVTLTNNGSGQGATLVASAGASSLPSTVGTNVGTQFFSMTQGATTYTNYAISVTKAGSGAVSQISLDANANNQYYGPRGVGVNQNPGTRNFGRIYVANANVAASPRLAGRGWFVLNADQSDVLGYGTNSHTAGITLSIATSGTTYSPFKCYVGADDYLYAADAMTNTCTVWQINPDLTGTATNVLDQIGLLTPNASINSSGTTKGNHGRTTGKPFVTGTLAAGNMVLYTIDADYTPTPNWIQRYTINAGPLPYTGTPTVLSDTGEDGTLAINDIAVSGTNIYATVYRANGDTDTVGMLKIFDSTGLIKVWDSFANSGTPGHDQFYLTQGMAVSPDGNYLATIRSDEASVIIHLTNGIPDVSSIFTNTATGGGTARGISWDLADNFYTVSGGADRLRVYSLGLSTTAITTGDTTGTGGNNNGTFQLMVPTTSVSVMATTPLASQNHGTPIPGVFTFSRAGQNLNQPLTAIFTVGGTATNGADYNFSPAVTTNITFAANQTTTSVTVNPVEDNIPRLTNTVVVTVQLSTNYLLGTPATDTVYIQNTGPQLLKIAALQAPSMYKPFANDYGSFTFTRYGDASASYTVTNFALSGTAVVGVDYAPPTVIINGGDVTDTVGVFPLVSTTSYTGNKTVTIGLANDATVGPGYTTTTDTVSMTIIDNADPPATVLYSSPLTNASDASNWTITFASTNDPLGLMPPDYDVEFGYQLANDSVGVPPNGSPTALKVSCNKNGTMSSCGVNLYLSNSNFTGDYAVRFNMNLLQGLSTLTSTEGALFGINHSGTASNWWAGDIAATGYRGPWASDGVWWWACSDPGGASAGDLIEYTGTNNVYPNTGWTRLAAVFRTSFPYAFKNVALAPASDAPYTAVGFEGLPANHAMSVATTWSDVEIKQVKNLVTMSINKTPITVYTNTTIWTNGEIMIGYDDPFASIGQYGAVYYSNLRVVRLGPPAITSIALGGGVNVNITFTSIDGDDTPASFALQSANAATGTYVDVSPAAVITQSGQIFNVVAAKSGGTQFYRIRHK